MQAWDSVMVKADVEIGGTDQKFNFLAAREYQKAEGQEPQVIMTHPLLVGLDGVKKMSKSLGNYIGITEEPEEIFGKAMSLPDELMAHWFLWVTDVTDEEAAVLLDPAKTHPREAKEALGRAIVTRYHKPADADRASAAFRKVFSEKKTPDDMPEIPVPAEPIWIVKLVVTASFAKSNGEARRLVEQGAVSLDGEKIADSKAEVTPVAGQVLKVGKRRFGKVRII